jgi:DHA1 family multidrug resistance protein-like MFS transporter
LAGSSLSIPFILAGALSVLAFVLILLILPESLLHKSATRKITGPQLSVLWQALAGPLGILFILSFLLSFGLTNFEGVFGLYAARKYGYGPQQVGTILTLVGIISAVIQGFLVGPLTRRFGEVIIIRLAFINTAISFILMVFAQTNLQVWLTVSYFVTSNAMLTPSVSSLISKRATGGQGIAMGLNNSFMSLGRIVGPLWAGFAFDSGINLPYLTGGAVMLVGFFLSTLKLSQSSAATEVEQAPAAVD